jgi:hypothetical protein
MNRAVACAALAIALPMETAGSDLGAAGAFAIVVHPGQGASVAEIWVSDRIRQVTVVESARITEGRHERESEVLAVRSVELLRASLADLWLSPKPPSPPSPSPPPSPPPPPTTTAASSHPAREAT